MRGLILLLLAALAAVLAPIAHAQPPAEEGLGIRLVEAPESLINDPRASTYIIDNLPPGTTINRKFEVLNNTGAPQNVRVYAGAARIEGDSGFIPADADNEVNELTTWMSVDRPDFTLQNGETTTVVGTIAVPEDAPEGEQYAVFWAEMGGDAPETSGTRLVSRVGIRVYLSVGEGNGPAADFVIDSVTPRRAETGEPEVLTTITNTGGRALDVTGSVNLSDGPAGLSAGPFLAVRAQTVAPGESGEVLFRFDPTLPNGPWTAAVTLKSGLVTREASATFTFPDSGTGDTVEVTKQGDGDSLPWIVAGVAVGVLLVVLLLLILLVLRRKSKKSQ